MESPTAVSAASFADGSKAEKHPNLFFRRFEYPLLSKRLRKPDEAAGCRESKESAYFPREFVWDTPESTIIHAGESEDESASDSTGLGIPSPPPYDDMEYYNPSGPSPPPPDSPRTIQKRMEERRKTAEETHGGCHVKEGGHFPEIHYRAAKEALEWYNCKNRAQFKLLQLVEVDIAAVSGIVFFITMKAVDGNDPAASPVTFLAEYYHKIFNPDDEVLDCKPIS
ncbi:unnamed protein product [Cuscuta epithymum]|uniref:Cysteine proteinase inhibitor n=1 Tax=Cuscuta epithymum TaxID=186058 RepID=A0AAV0F5P1_9ASTE|nr:unnamed protein product [Cuscuta epithymum]